MGFPNPNPHDFKPGNQAAAGSSYDLNAEGIALDEWSKRDDAVALVGFCVERDIYAQRLYEWRDKSQAFAEILNKTQTRIAHRQRTKLHDKTSPYNYGLFMREIGHHDKFLNMYEDDEKNKDAKRAKAIEETKVEEFKVQMSCFMEMLKATQQPQATSTSAFNSADISMSKEAKS